MVEPGVDFDMSNETDLGWDAVEPEHQTDASDEPDAENHMSDYAEFANDEAPVDLPLIFSSISD